MNQIATRTSMIIEVRSFIRQHHKSDVHFDVGRDENDKVEVFSMCLGNPEFPGNLCLDLLMSDHVGIYDAEGDEIDKEVFVEELKAIVDAHNEKYTNE